jgi:hypothetical protein
VRSASLLCPFPCFSRTFLTLSLSLVAPFIAFLSRPSRTLLRSTGGSLAATSRAGPGRAGPRHPFALFLRHTRSCMHLPFPETLASRPSVGFNLDSEDARATTRRPTARFCISQRPGWIDAPFITLVSSIGSPARRAQYGEGQTIGGGRRRRLGRRGRVQQPLRCRAQSDEPVPHAAARHYMRGRPEELYEEAGRACCCWPRCCGVLSLLAALLMRFRPRLASLPPACLSRRPLHPRPAAPALPSKSCQRAKADKRSPVTPIS